MKAEHLIIGNVTMLTPAPERKRVASYAIEAMPYGLGIHAEHSSVKHQGRDQNCAFWNVLDFQVSGLSP